MSKHVSESFLPWPVSPLLAQHSHAQTYRGGITGTIVEPSGAVVSGAQVTAVETGTSTTYKTVSSSAGDFTFANLLWAVTGFPRVGRGVSELEGRQDSGCRWRRLYTAHQAAYCLHRRDDRGVRRRAHARYRHRRRRPTALTRTVVQNLPNSGRDFTQMLSQTTGFAGLSTGGGARYPASTAHAPTPSTGRSRAPTTTICGGALAVNQGGVSAIAGVILPVDAIENFDFVTPAPLDRPQLRRHGQPGHQIRHQLDTAAATTSTTTSSSRRQPLSAQGPSPAISITDSRWRTDPQEPALLLHGRRTPGFHHRRRRRRHRATWAYVQDAKAVLTAFGVPVNTVSTNLLYGNGTLPGLWPTSVVGQNASIASKTTLELSQQRRHHRS